MYKIQEEQKEMSLIKQRCQDLENALSKAHLQIAGLETLIDVAKKELHIDLQKGLVPNNGATGRSLRE